MTARAWCCSAVTAATAALQKAEEKKKALTETARVLRAAAEAGAAACRSAPVAVE